MIEVTIPLPPSANALFANAKRGRVKTGAYKAWLEEAGWHLVRAWTALGKPVWNEDPRPMRLEIAAGLRSRTRDLSNTCKAIEDALVKYLPVPDDRWNDCIVMMRSPSVAEGLARVRLEVLPPD